MEGWKVIKFKALEAEDIEVRVQQVTEKGCSLLLYKNARTDAKILDEVVGQENWDCEYSEVNGYLFCTVGIRCKLDNGELSWVRKSDTGTASNMEPEKGHASDAFKRACTKWGIGRELYTAPFIWVPKEALKKHFEANGKWKCNDRFSVQSVSVADGRITELAIANGNGETVYKMGSKSGKNGSVGKSTQATKTTAQKAPKGRYDTIKRLKAEAIGLGIKESGIEEEIAVIIQGKPKKDMTAADIKAVEKYLEGIIKDKKALNG